MLEQINWTALSFGMSAVAMASNAALYLYVQVQRKHAATDKQVTDLDKRLTVVEAEVRSAPDRKDWSDVRDNITSIAGDVKTSAAEIKGLGAGLKRVESQVSMLVENELKGSMRK